MASADKFVSDEIDRIQKSAAASGPAIEDGSKAIQASGLGPQGPKSIIDNTAYHDYHRIELGTPMVVTTTPDLSIPPKVGKVMTIVNSIPHLFGQQALTATPTDADDVQDLLDDINADLDSLAAGPIPAVIQSFVINALADYLEQGVWSALSQAERERLGQLAAAWRALTAPLTDVSSGDSTAAPATPSGSKSPTDTALDILDPGGVRHLFGINS